MLQIVAEELRAREARKRHIDETKMGSFWLRTTRTQRMRTSCSMALIPAL